jgi:predicted site-specific integrase-resolvase
VTVTTEEAATLAGVQPSTIRSWVLRGWLEPVRRGARPLRFVYDDVSRCQFEHRPETWRRRHDEAVRRWVGSRSATDMQR